MKIATWNIGSLYTEYSKNKKAIQSVLAENPVDVLCFQEFPNRMEDISNTLQWGQFSSYEYLECCPSHVCIGSMMGIAVFSKLPIRLISRIMLEPPDVPVEYNGRPEKIHQKAFLAFDVSTDKNQYLIITGHGFPFHRYHLENNEELFLSSYDELNHYIERSIKNAKGRTSIICGDFNARDIAQYIPALRESFVDLFQNDVTRTNGLKMDAVFVEKAKESWSKRIIKTALDHFMLVVQV